MLVDADGYGLDAAHRGRAALRREGIETRRYYSPPVHAMRAYRRPGTGRSICRSPSRPADRGAHPAAVGRDDGCPGRGRGGGDRGGSGRRGQVSLRAECAGKIRRMARGSVASGAYRDHNRPWGSEPPEGHEKHGRAREAPRPERRVGDDPPRHAAPWRDRGWDPPVGRARDPEHGAEGAGGCQAPESGCLFRLLLLQRGDKAQSPGGGSPAAHPA